MIHRLYNPLLSNSFFLFGPRGSGKSSLLYTLFPPSSDTLWVDLLIPEVWDEYHLEPSRLIRKIEAQNVKWVIIDEIQKAPKLLDVVHSVIENKKNKPPRFALSGSSSRRLKQAGVNLLAGRAFVSYLFPFLSEELGGNFNLDRALNFGLFPKIWVFDEDRERQEFLKSYSMTYLSSEIKGEQWVRNLEPFHSFLPIVAQMNGQLINFSKISRDVGVGVHTLQNYFSILEDTLMGFRVEPFARSIRKRQKQSPKFYFIDPGIKRAFERRFYQILHEGTSDYGWAFEHFVILEIYKLNLYKKTEYSLNYLRTGDNVDIDLILHRPGSPEALIEIKSATKIHEDDFKSLIHFKNDFPKGLFFLISRDPSSQEYKGVRALYWKQFLSEFFNS